MKTLKEAAEATLPWLEQQLKQWPYTVPSTELKEAINNLKTALTQAEPVAWLAYDGAHQLFIVGGMGPHDIYGGFPVYLAPPAPQPQAEPVATVRLMRTGGNVGLEWRGVPVQGAQMMYEGEPLYAAPPTRAAVRLTDEEIGKIAVAADNEYGGGDDWAFIFSRAIERAVLAKNGIVGGVE